MTTIGSYTFNNCQGVATVTIPAGVTSIGNQAFGWCSDLAQIYFRGNAPAIGSDVFVADNNATAYYLPGAAGWDSFPYSPTILWNPAVLTGDPTFGVRTNQFGFTVSVTNTLVVVVEGCTNLSNPEWQPLQTNTLTSGSFYFSDPLWTNYPSRFYRLCMP